jgi:hypothetical protein
MQHGNQRLNRSNPEHHRAFLNLLFTRHAISRAGFIDEDTMPFYFESPPDLTPPKRDRRVWPVYNLMAAVIEEAIIELRHGRNVEEIHKWLNSPTRNYIFSFMSICDSLHLNETKTRDQILSQAPKNKRIRIGDHRA